MARRLGAAVLFLAGCAFSGGVPLPAFAADPPAAYELQLSVGGMEGTPFGLGTKPGSPLMGSLELLPPKGTSSIAAVARFALTIGDTTWTEADVTHSKVSLRGGEVQWRDSVLRATKGTPPTKVVLGRCVNAATDERDGSETLSFADVTCRRCADAPRPCPTPAAEKPQASPRRFAKVCPGASRSVRRFARASSPRGVRGVDGGIPPGLFSFPPNDPKHSRRAVRPCPPGTAATPRRRFP